MSASPCTTLAARFADAGLDWIVPQWPAPLRVQAFVTTRNGGNGASRSLDLGDAWDDATPDTVAAIADARRRVRAFLPAEPTWLAQVHGSDVIVARESRSEHAPHADAAVTRTTNVVLAIRIADCLPVLLADRAATVAGAAHAGWRGLAAGVLERAVEAMACEPAQVVAWLGPAIGPSAFEVGADVHAAFTRTDPAAGAAFTPGRPGKWYADLEALARMRLHRAGVTSVHGGGMCTASDPARFFSFRRDRAKGRMAAFVWLAETGA